MQRFLYLSCSLFLLSLAVLIGSNLGTHDASATIVTAPVGNIIAAASDRVMTWNGEIWFHHDSSGWQKIADSPVPVSEVHAMTAYETRTFVVSKGGDYWERLGTQWYNRGSPPTPPVPTKAETWGKVKREYNGK